MRKQILLLGASGSGKTTTQKILKKRGLKMIVLYTTRPRREYEVDGVDYHFVSGEQFAGMEKNREFAESACYRGWYYGIALADCGIGDSVISVTPAGLRTLKGVFEKNGLPFVSVYLKVDWRTRLVTILNRGDDIMEAYRRTLTEVGQFDCVEKEVTRVIDNEGHRLTPDEVADIILGMSDPSANETETGDSGAETEDREVNVGITRAVGISGPVPARKGDTVKLKVRRLSDAAVLPTRGSEYAAGLDLYAVLPGPVEIRPHETVMIGTGLATAIPEGYYGALVARSGLAKEGARPANCIGIVDSDYRGELLVAMHNDREKSIFIEPRQRMAQLVVSPYLHVTVEECDSLGETERGAGGFGHTGTH